MLEDLRVLVELAHIGSIAGAADRLFRTPSAVTRQVQELEAAHRLLQLSGLQDILSSVLDRSLRPSRPFPKRMQSLPC